MEAFTPRSVLIVLRYLNEAEVGMPEKGRQSAAPSLSGCAFASARLRNPLIFSRNSKRASYVRTSEALSTKIALSRQLGYLRRSANSFSLTVSSAPYSLKMNYSGTQ
jgi:hypothetical protein